MKFINPHAEWWKQQNPIRQIARVGRICYKSKGKQPDPAMSEAEIEAFIDKRDEQRCLGFWTSGHRSMYRHGSVYFFIPNDSRLPGNIWACFIASPFIDYVADGHRVFISTNMQYYNEHANLQPILEPYVVTEEKFIEKALKLQCTDALMLLRMTLVVTTQRIQGESYNRKSPNNIAQESTRYVNLAKKDGVMICRPHWEAKAKWYQIWASHFGYWVAEKVYKFLLFTGLQPEDARGNLTYNTYTLIGYTYNLLEWRHIMDMRLRNTTGRAHPDARILAQRISEAINGRMRQYIPDFEI